MIIFNYQKYQAAPAMASVLADFSLLQTKRKERSPKIAIKRKKWQKIRQSHMKNQKRANHGVWRLRETIIYINFLKKNPRQEYISEQKRASYFLQMAAQIKTRTSLQCRSHHQKMLLKYRNASNVIDYYEKTIIPKYVQLQNQMKIEKQQKKTCVQTPFCEITRKQNGVIRIELNEQCIESY